MYAKIFEIKKMLLGNIILTILRTWGWYTYTCFTAVDINLVSITAMI
jgi:hypothetical protein